MSIVQPHLKTKDIAKRLGITAGRVRQLTAQGRFVPMEKIGNTNIFPLNAVDGYEKWKRGRKPTKID